MTHMDDQVAQHCKDIILRATLESAQNRPQPCEAGGTLDRAVRVLREQSAYPVPPYTPPRLTRFSSPKN